MKLIIELAEADGKLLDGFCSRTHWDARLGVTPEEWLNKKTAEWIVQQARGGSVMIATQTQRDSLIAATRTAISTAASEIIMPAKVP